MKVIIKNFLRLFSRFRTATLLNILGLSVAFAAFIVIMIQVSYDLGYNKSDPNIETIYRVEASADGRRIAILARPFTEALANSSPHIIASAITEPTSFINHDWFFSIEQDETKKHFLEKKLGVSENFTDVFYFEMIEGSDKVLEEPDKALIPHSLAKKLFGNRPAINQLLIGKDYTLTVGGVYKDFPANNNTKNLIYNRIDDENKTTWTSFNYHHYIRVDQPGSTEGLIDNFMQNFDMSVFDGMAANMEFSLSPLKEIHFDTGVDFDADSKINKSTVYVLISIAFIILIIAVINYTNYSMALTPMRIKSINTQKVLGASDRRLRLTLQAEAVGLCIISWILSLGIVYLISLSPVESIFEANINLSEHLGLLAITATIACIIGLIAGVYPSRYITSFSPALVLKGSFGLSPKGRQLRNGLISLQFIVSFTLVIITVFMYLQNRYMQTTSLGFNKEHILIADVNDYIRINRDVIRNDLQTLPSVKNTAFSFSPLSGTDTYISWVREHKNNDFLFQVIPVTEEFLTLMDIDVPEGRNFTKSDVSSTQNLFIFNENARQEFDLELGKLSEGQIIGFIPDIKFMSLRKAVAPMAFMMINDEWYYSYLFIKFEGKTDMAHAFRQVKDILDNYSQGYPVNLRFLDQLSQELYEKEQKLTMMITAFSFLAILISIVGVFGLVIFESEYRRKEIGVRKVLGSSTWGVLKLFNGHYFNILFICFIIAAPIAYYSISNWLENFAYKIPVYWWVFLLAFCPVVLITLATVTFQSWRVANDNPVNSLKSE